MLTHWSLRGHLHGPLCDNLSAMLKARGGCITAHTRCNWFLFRVAKSVPVLGTCFGRRFECKTAHVRCNWFSFWVPKSVPVLGTCFGSKRVRVGFLHISERWVPISVPILSTHFGSNFRNTFLIFFAFFCIILHAFRAPTHVLLLQRPVRIHSNLARTIDLVRYVEPRGHDSEQPRLHTNLGAETCS